MLDTHGRCMRMAFKCAECEVALEHKVAACSHIQHVSPVKKCLHSNTKKSAQLITKKPAQSNIYMLQEYYKVQFEELVARVWSK